MRSSRQKLKFVSSAICDCIFGLTITKMDHEIHRAMVLFYNSIHLTVKKCH